MRILIIDDDPMIRLLMDETLAPLGFEVMAAENGADGVALALEKSPDVVLLDIIMPGMDGFSCLAALKTRPPGGRPEIPVVILTGMEDATSIERAFAMGATDFIHKPIDWPLLPHRLRFVHRAHVLTQELQTSEERLRLSMRAANQGFYDLNFKTGQAVTNESYAAMLGYDPSKFEETIESWLNKLHPDDRETAEKTYLALIAGEQKEYRAEFRLACADGSWKWILSIGSIVEYDDQGAPLRMLGTHTDIDHLKQSEERLRLLGSVFEHSGEGIMVCDANQTIVEVNQSFTKITGFAPDEVIGNKPRLLPSLHHDAACHERMWQALNETGYWQGEVWNRRKNGELFPVWLGVSTVRGVRGKPSHYITIFSDITEHKAAESKIEYLAHHDPLTGLPNRTLLTDRFNQAVAHAVRNQSLVALLFLDLDQFKLVNDTLGHDVGDHLLQAIASRLLQNLREVDTLCRQGGDEFIIVLGGLQNTEAMAQVAQKILQQLHQPFLIDGTPIITSFSIGISIYPTDGFSLSSLLSKADTAMYTAKKQGRNTFRFFSNSMNQASIERIKQENDLRLALENGELSLYFQPQYAIRDRQLVGAEALLRWIKDNGEQVPPDQFIPMAEDTGLIIPIGDWVLHEACRQNRLWHDAGLELTVNVNVSTQQFKQGDLVASVRSALAESGLDPRYLELELTERTLMLDTGVVMEIMEELRNIGVVFAIDDFGACYSSLSYLKRFTVDKLKIDRSFINELSEEQGKNNAIVQAIIQLGQTLDIQVIAKGVETKMQLDQLRRFGCEKVQGYFLNRPLPVAEFEREMLALPEERS